MLELINGIDSDILLWIQDNLRNDFLTPVFSAITKLGDGGMFLIITGVILTIFKRTRNAGILFLFSLLLNFIVNNLIIKNAVARIRPYEALDTLKALIPSPHGYSFPSGHTSAAFSCAVVFWFVNKKVFWATIILALLIGFSRLYLGVHYPTDVLFGMIFGSAIAVFTAKMYEKSVKKCRFLK